MGRLGGWGQCRMPDQNSNPATLGTNFAATR